MPGLFGSSKSKPQVVSQESPNTVPFRGTINTPSFNFGGGQLTRTNTDVLNRERRLAGLFGSQTGALTDFRNNLTSTFNPIRSQVEPLFGLQSKALKDVFGARRTAAEGTLREQLRSKRVLGSSFAADALSRQSAEFALQEGVGQAQVAQAELEQKIALEFGISQAQLGALQEQRATLEAENQAIVAQATRELGELSSATQFLQTVNQITSAQAQAQTTNAAVTAAQSAQRLEDRRAADRGR